MRHHIKKNLLTSTKVFCRYDELDTNIIENQVVRLGLEMEKRFSLTKQTFRLVNRLADEFIPVTDTYQSDIWPSFAYNRLNQHYKKAHKLAYYIWQQQYINNIYRVTVKSHYSFLLDMNELFEKFITSLLQKFLPKNMKVTGQYVFKKSIMKNGVSYHDISRTY